MKNANFIFVVLSFLLIMNKAFSQSTGLNYDVIIKKDGSTILCTINKITDYQIVVTPKEEKSFLIIFKNDVESILYADGTLVKFETSFSDSDKHDNYKPIFELLDEDDKKVTDAVILENASFIDNAPIYITHMVGHFKNMYYVEGTRRDTFQIKIVAKWTSRVKSNTFKIKTGPEIFFESITIGIAFFEDHGSKVLQREFQIPNFSLGFENSFGNNKKLPVTNNIQTGPITYKGLTFYPTITFNHANYNWDKSSTCNLTIKVNLN